MMSMVFIILEIISISIIFAASQLLFQGDGSREQKLMQYFLMGSLIQNAGYLLELTAPVVETAIVAVKVQYMGSIVVPISYCYFIFHYCCEKVPEKILRCLKIIDLAIVALVFTCDLHHFYYRGITWLKTADGHGYLSLDYGPGYWLFMVFGTIVPYLLSLYALICACIKRPEYASDRRYKLILGLSILPVVALGSYSMKLTYVYDPTPFILGLVLSAVVILIWSRNVYDFSSLASGILIDSMSDGVIALDEQKRIVSYNSAAAEIFTDLGIRAKGKSIEELEGFPQDILGQDVKEEFRLNGSYYQGHVKQIFDKFGKYKGYVVLILDVTETRNYIEEIKQVREQAEQANVAKSAFLANMSHEIRTPMNAIVGLSDVIMEESRGRKVYEYACDIKSSSKNLLALINDILDLSKVEAGKMELVPTDYHIKTLVNEVINMMDVVASQRGLMLKSQFDMTLPSRYYGDEGRIKQILINLLNNALKFTTEGYVKISVDGIPKVSGETECLLFRVEDTGCGIREEDLPGIFENFKQVDSKRNRSVEGTGLGLSITRHLVELMQGTIRIESVYGEGTTFFVEIPQRVTDRRTLAENPEEETAKEEKLEPFYAPGCHVLVVDDNRVNRKVANMFLRSYRLDIEEAKSGPEAIARVQAKRYDIIFMDHMMPQMDGIEAVQIIRRECGDNGRLPVIVALTANAMEGVKENFLANGFQDFLTKPLERKRLHEALQRWIPEDKKTTEDVPLERVQADENRHAAFGGILIEGIDTDELVGRYSGSVLEYMELLQLYCLDGKRKIGLLRKLWESRDYQTYGIEVHGLKSASANVGAMKVSKIAREQESAVDRGDFTFVDSHVTRLLTEYEEQIAHIRAFLDQNQEQKNAAKQREIPKEELLSQIREALDCLENFRSKECAKKVEEMLQFLLQDEVETSLREIQEQLKLYEDDAAEQLLRELIEKIEKGDR